MGSTEHASEVSALAGFGLSTRVLAGVASSLQRENPGTGWGASRGFRGVNASTHSLVTSISRRLKGEPDPDIDIVPRNPQSTAPAPVGGLRAPGWKNSNVFPLPGYALISQADVRCRLSAAGLKHATNSSVRRLESRRYEGAESDSHRLPRESAASA